MKDKSITPQQQEQLLQLINQKMGPHYLAMHLRRTAYILSRVATIPNEVRLQIDEEWLDSGFYWLHELSEILDPQLTKGN